MVKYRTLLGLSVKMVLGTVNLVATAAFMRMIKSATNAGNLSQLVRQKPSSIGINKNTKVECNRTLTNLVGGGWGPQGTSPFLKILRAGQITAKMFGFKTAGPKVPLDTISSQIRSSEHPCKLQTR